MEDLQKEIFSLKAQQEKNQSDQLKQVREAERQKVELEMKRINNANKQKEQVVKQPIRRDIGKL
jgi:hypothetical protein